MKKIKKIAALLLTLALALGVCLALVSCGGNEGCNNHVDNDGNGVCDTEGCDFVVESKPTACTNHTDANNDGICDTEGCNEPVTKPDDEEVDTKTAYTITVVDNYERPVSGVSLSVKMQGGSTETAITDATGKAVVKFQIDEDSVVKIKATITELPAGYKTKADGGSKSFEAGSTSLTIAVDVVTEVTHSIKLVDADGNALNVAGASILVCQHTCQLPVTTDENGEATITFEPVDGMYLKVKIENIDTLGARAGYTYSEDVDAEGYIHFVEGTEEIVIVLVTK